MPIFKALLDQLMAQASPYRTAPTPGHEHPTADKYRNRRASTGMPVLDRNDDLGRLQQGADITAYAERGQDIPSHLYQGLPPEAIIEALGSGGQMRALGGEPMSQFMDRFAEPKVIMKADPVQQDENAVAVDSRIKKAEAVDSFVGEHGYAPQLFTGKSAMQAAQVISDQLRARRAAMLGRPGDPMIWAPAFVSEGI